MLAWGVNDLPGLAHHPARLTFAFLMLGLQFALVLFMPGAITRGQGAGTQIVRRQRIALLLLQLLTLAIVVAAPFSDRREILVFSGVDALRYLGLVFVPMGFLLMHWAVVVLGKQFSVQVTIQKHHQLVVDGPYRHLRHPRYLGLVMFFTGISLVFRSEIALALVALLTLVLLWRIHDEEEMMQKEFGPAWMAYTRRSWRLIPFVY
jgi:protein-S-isoprenylcysteine O-methyltransferase Ste14